MIENILNSNSKKATSPHRKGSSGQHGAMVNNLMSEMNSASTSFKNLPFLAARKESKDTKNI